MSAIVIHAAKDLRIEKREAGEPGPGEVRVRTAIGGICGSDLHYYNDGGLGTAHLREPMVLGHEVSGRVDKLGAGVSGLREGDLIAVSPSRPCRACGYCLRGLLNHCENMRFYGSAMPFPHIQGAFSQSLVTGAAQCAPAGDLTPGEAAMAEPLAVGLHAVRRAGDLLGKRILVTGCGPIGALAILAARRAGAGEIIATDLSGYALDFAKHVGADVAINMAEEPEALEAYAAGKGTIDTLIECSGATTVLAQALPCLRPRGVLVQLGLGGEMPVPMMTITAKEIELRGSFRFHEEFHTGIDLMRKGLIDVTPLITDTKPLAEACEAFELAGNRNQAMKVQLNFA
ncbi:L-idonate 5-dehydrogenase [Salinisphaera sp. USBA-960]|nr:L-idonate 5-dehydrogenase [Salifodinibacter halophilus]NNC25411.1 L-idonate 5-dehydrogenase [Salifodinibacter halophilus]